MKTEQECFDITCNHLMTQRVRAVNEHGFCMYRGEQGRKCAVGAWIEDDKYTPEMEDKRVGELIQGFRPNLPPEIIAYPDLFFRLQRAHDEGLLYSVQDCAIRLQSIAQEHSLTVPECVERELEPA